MPGCQLTGSAGIIHRHCAERAASHVLLVGDALRPGAPKSKGGRGSTDQQRTASGCFLAMSRRCHGFTKPLPTNDGQCSAGRIGDAQWEKRARGPGLKGVPNPNAAAIHCPGRTRIPMRVRPLGLSQDWCRFLFSRKDRLFRPSSGRQPREPLSCRRSPHVEHPRYGYRNLVGAVARCTGVMAAIARVGVDQRRRAEI